MNVALSKYYEDMVGDLIESGRYGNSSEVVRAGLALWKSRAAGRLEHSRSGQKLLAGIRSPAKALTDSDFNPSARAPAANSRNLKPLKIIAAKKRFATSRTSICLSRLENPDAAERFLLRCN